ncbi:MAG: pyridoxamine 5'-phosphate oxidase family protein [Actinobacteria bacterium]|nr:pyridoxamine 5'-phosphate oxidase family protein [Actinomycetota bacterium]
MGRTYSEIDGRTARFITSQPIFFVATAPLSLDGHINCSPKGNRGELAVLGGSYLAWLDQTGSGAETVAHLLENSRIVVMFCAFEGKPRIVRIHGSGEAVLAGDPRFAPLVDKVVCASSRGGRQEPSQPDSAKKATAQRLSPLDANSKDHRALGVGLRAVIVVSVTRVSDSCGYGVPLMEFKGHRRELDAWGERKGLEGLAMYRKEKNSTSIDGLPAFRSPGC